MKVLPVIALTLIGFLNAQLLSAQASAGDVPRIQPGVSADSIAAPDSVAPGEAARPVYPESRVQNRRVQDQRGVNVFESPKDEAAPWVGFAIDFGAAFAQQFQTLEHENRADVRGAVTAAGTAYDANQLIDLGPGFNLATANLYLDAQLAPGVRVALTSYLSSRHHEETWVKDGYIQFDASPIDHPVLNSVMDFVTVKAGMMELNYGDAHFRRTDNGQALRNPFVGNYILDSFTTEIGGEVYLRDDGLLAMVGVTGGVNKGDVTSPDARGPAYLMKLGMDQQFSRDFRLRLTGSLYNVEKTPGATLFGGDRGGSRYYLVLENTQATPKANFTSGLLNPGFRNELTAVQINPFIEYGDLEIFGVIERATGKASSEDESRAWNHYAADVIYRFLADDRLYLGLRYNQARGEMAELEDKVGATRWQMAGGWFVTPTVLLKAEYVRQSYDDFPSADIRSGGEFDGFVVEGAVAF